MQIKINDFCVARGELEYILDNIVVDVSYEQWGFDKEKSWFLNQILIDAAPEILQCVNKLDKVEEDELVELAIETLKYNK